METTTYHLSLKSSNAKTGPIPVSTTSGETCPTSCGQYSTCYAKQGPLAMHWRKVSAGERGMGLAEFAQAILDLPEGTLWRHNQAGDLPGTNEVVDTYALAVLVEANKGRRGFTYTHKPMTAENVDAVKHANENGFTVNLSADTLADADRLKALRIAPVVVVVPENVNRNFTTPAGNKVVICPATQRDNVSCATCKLCAWSGRDAIIAFPAHGSKRKQVKSDYVSIEGVK